MIHIYFDKSGFLYNPRKVYYNPNCAHPSICAIQVLKVTIYDDPITLVI